MWEAQVSREKERALSWEKELKGQQEGTLFKEAHIPRRGERACNPRLGMHLLLCAAVEEDAFSEEESGQALQERASIRWCSIQLKRGRIAVCCSFIQQRRGTEINVLISEGGRPYCTSRFLGTITEIEPLMCWLYWAHCFQTVKVWIWGSTAGLFSKMSTVIYRCYVLLL